MKILARAITGSMDFLQLDPYVLHRTMHNLSRTSYQALEIDYGEITGRDTFWKSHPGEEVRRTWLLALRSSIAD